LRYLTDETIGVARLGVYGGVVVENGQSVAKPDGLLSRAQWRRHCTLGVQDLHVKAKPVHFLDARFEVISRIAFAAAAPGARRVAAGRPRVGPAQRVTPHHVLGAGELAARQEILELRVVDSIREMRVGVDLLRADRGRGHGCLLLRVVPESETRPVYNLIDRDDPTFAAKLALLRFNQPSPPKEGALKCAPTKAAAIL
jgi:hypothetical protein